MSSQFYADFTQRKRTIYYDNMLFIHRKEHLYPNGDIR